MKRLLVGLLSAAALLAGAAQAADAPPPSPALALQPHAMVAAANPLAAQAGLEVLKHGGSAMDAAVAVQAVLALVEPQSSSLAGGSFMIYFDGKTHRLTAYDGREVAPAGATPALFLGPDGKPMGFGAAILSGHSAGVPGAIAMLYLAQHEHGRLPWKSLFTDGERLGDDGFIVSPRLAGMISLKQVPQHNAPDVAHYFSKPDGTLMTAGDRLTNHAYADVLRKIAVEGPRAILAGPIAADIIKRLHEDPLPSTMTLADLANYRPHETPALCRPYREYLVCSDQAPSGGMAVIEALGLLEHTDIATRGPTDPQAWLEIGEAEELMYADRDTYEGDPAFVHVPVDGLLDPAYLTARAQLIGTSWFAHPPAAGHPAGAPNVGLDATAEPGGTSHFVIVDAAGNVVSMTTTVESIFGDGRMVDGFFLNNQLTDFSFAPVTRGGLPVANAVAAGKRPRSSMAPVIVLDKQGKFVAAVGSPGGNAIPAYVLKTLVAVLDWHMSMQDAAALPNLIARGGSVQTEPAKFAPGVVDALTAKGLPIRAGYAAEGSGIHGVIARPGGYEGGADPRREGVAIGY
ncbi:MAG TPA: gamma-glutamyltransferase family protein [Caulobacteraceae bacterium]|jgi:gamma-glutamyltranspeptidase/glutathione hydrolase|nr:gamma-glutamyltransferase family protein [Caulobacteraceae bacterium]